MDGGRWDWFCCRQRLNDALHFMNTLYEGDRAFYTIFNLKGNQYRLIVGIDYVSGTVYYKYLLTHADYNKEKWKNDPYF
jgi:mRNA-degrading endonuclease HigB of HigAB toxin-antitoxin module